MILLRKKTQYKKYSKMQKLCGYNIHVSDGSDVIFSHLRMRMSNFGGADADVEFLKVRMRMLNFRKCGC